MKKNNFAGKVFVTNSFRETQELGKDFARFLAGGDIVCLHGDLGSGKTTFIQGLSRGIGIKNRIISPTFVIVRCYKLQNQNCNSKFKSLEPEAFYHTDLYRIESEKDIKSLGLEEIINNKNNIVAIEWAEKLRGLLPKDKISIRFEYVGEKKRKITIGELI